MTGLLNPFAHDLGGGNDSAFSHVVQLAHFDGANGSQTLTNSCPRGNTMTTTTIALSTAQSKFGGTSVLDTGAGSNGAVAASHSDYAFGTSDWTIEFWVYPLAVGAQAFIDFRNTSLTTAWAPTMGSLDGTGKIYFYANGASRITSASGVYVANAWQHIACSRVSGTTRLFMGGTQVGSDFTDANTYVQNGFHLCLASNAGNVYHGYMDELRITNGFGRYPSNFGVPTTAFPNF